MKYRALGKSGFQTSEIGLGCWQLGGDWGDISSQTADEILSEAIENGINFVDTADVYGNGRSERIIGQFLMKTSETIFVATKIGRSSELYPNRYTEQKIRKGIEASLQRLQCDAIDMVQLHCIPREILNNGDIFDWLRRLKKEGKIKTFGASVETMDEAMLCMEQEQLCSLQIIFNIYRQKPIEKVLKKAIEKNVGIIVRLPFASGLLTGKFTKDTIFPESDHRNYNRDGEAFNVGETFAGLRFEKGVKLTEQLKTTVPQGMTMAQMVLRWILDFDAVSVIIPGASHPDQVRENISASEHTPLPTLLHEHIREIYNEDVKDNIRGPY